MPELSGARIGRVCLRVTDPAAVAAFYRDVVGLDELDGATTLGAGDTPLVELRGDPDAPARPPDAAGLFHLAIRVPTRAALGAALARVEERWDLDGASDHGVSEALYLRDPEGNGVEIYRDRPREAWPTDGDRVAMGTRPLDREGVTAAADGSAGVPPATDVGHVHLDAADLDATRDFYADAVGLAVRQRLPEAVFLAADGYHHHVGANTWRGRTEPPSGRGLEWFEIRAPEEGVESLRARVDARETDAGVAVTDPSGVELRVRPEGAVL